MDETSALDPFQSGFRLRHGTETALVALLDDLLREANRGKMYLLVLLDISDTFDNHRLQYTPGTAFRVGDWWSGSCLAPVRLGGPFPESPAWRKYIGPVAP